jgi:hypothetical protein
MCAEASPILRAVAADFFFNCWYLEIPSDNRIPNVLRCDGCEVFFHSLFFSLSPILLLLVVIDQPTRM